MFIFFYSLYRVFLMMNKGIEPKAPVAIPVKIV